MLSKKKKVSINIYLLTYLSPRVCMYTNTYTLIINASNTKANNNKHEETTCMTTCQVAIDFSRSREHEPSNSATFVRLNVFDYKRAKQGDQRRKVVETSLS